MGRNKDIIDWGDSTPSFYRKHMHEVLRKPELNKKEERSLRRQQMADAVTEDSMPVLDQPVVIVDVTKLVAEEDSIATVKDWEVRMLHQEIRLAQVTSEAERRNLAVPSEWVAYEAKLSQAGTPLPPQGLANE